MPKEYLFPPVEIDGGEIAQQAFDYLETQIDGWEANPGALDVIMLEAVGRLAATLYQLTGDVATGVFRWFGAWVVGILPIAGTAASVDSTWTMVDDLGHIIPAGTQVAIPTSGDDYIAFETTEETTIVVGQTSATGVNLQAVEVGEHTSGLSGTPELIDLLPYVDTVALEADTSGGVDAELDADFLQRLVLNLTLIAPRPIIPSDFSAMATNIAGVERATPLDLYDLSSETWGNERTITVALVDEDGAAVSSAVKQEVDDYLQEHREVNFVVYVTDPDFNDVNVTTHVVHLPDYEADAVVADVEAALTDYLDPANWGDDSGLGDWRNMTVVRYNDIIGRIDRVRGVDYVGSLTLNGGSANVTLTGVAPLTRPGTLTVTAGTA